MGTQSRQGNKTKVKQMENADSILKFLIGLANDTKTQMTYGVTLNVGGIIITGKLIGYAQFLESFADTFAGGLAASGHEEMGRVLKKSFIATLDEEDLDLASSDPQYIHLADARFYNSASEPIPSNEGMLWRGKLSSVDGFILGSLSKGKKK